MAEGIHGVSDGGNIRRISIAGVGFCQERIAVAGPGVGDGVGWAGDSLEEVAAGEVAVSEGISAVADGVQTTGGAMIRIVKLDAGA